MSRLRLLLLVAGAGTLLAGLPAQGAVRPPPAQATRAPAAGQIPALQLLLAASSAARVRSYSGTQYVSTWRDDSASSSVADVRHSAAAGSVVAVRPTAGVTADDSVTSTTDLDPRLLTLLASHYVLTVARDASCAGRPARVVEARRRDGDGVAGRFWIDSASSLLLRRETYDRSGELVRSSAFTTLTVAPAAMSVAAVGSASVAELDGATVEQFRRDGWQIPSTLADDLELYDARMRTHGGKPVLHLSYSDGLSTLSLFAQRGTLGGDRMAGFRRQKLGGDPVWIRPSSPERVVWGGGGRVFTLLSDAPPDTVRAAVTGLPHEPPRRTGLLARLGRGLARLGSWLNPFG